MKKRRRLDAEPYHLLSNAELHALAIQRAMNLGDVPRAVLLRVLRASDLKLPKPTLDWRAKAHERRALANDRPRRVERKRRAAIQQGILDAIRAPLRRNT